MDIQDWRMVSGTTLLRDVCGEKVGEPCTVCLSTSLVLVFVQE